MRGASAILKPIGLAITIMLMIASIYFINTLSIQEQIRSLLFFVVTIIFIVFTYYLFTS